MNIDSDFPEIVGRYQKSSSLFSELHVPFPLDNHKVNAHTGSNLELPKRMDSMSLQEETNGQKLVNQLPSIKTSFELPTPSLIEPSADSSCEALIEEYKSCLRKTNSVTSKKASDLIVKIKSQSANDHIYLQNLLVEGSKTFVNDSSESAVISLKMWEEAYHVANKHQDYIHMAFAMNNVSLVHKRKNDHQKALVSSDHAWKMILKAMKFANNTPKETLKILSRSNSSSSNSESNICSTQQPKDSMKLSKSVGIPTVVGMMDISLNRGNIYYDLGQYLDAIDHYESCLTTCMDALEIWPLPNTLKFAFDKDPIKSRVKAKLSRFHAHILETRMKALSSIGCSYWKIGDISGSSEYINRSLASLYIYEKMSLKKVTAEISAQVFGNFAIQMHSVLKFREAILINAMALSKFDQQVSKSGLVKSLVNHGALLGEFAKTYKHCNRAYNHAQYIRTSLRCVSESMPSIHLTFDAFEQELSIFVVVCPILRLINKEDVNKISMLDFNAVALEASMNDSTSLFYSTVDRSECLLNRAIQLSSQTNSTNFAKLNLASIKLLSYDYKATASLIVSCTTDWSSLFAQENYDSNQLIPQGHSRYPWAQALFNISQVVMYWAFDKERYPGSCPTPHVQKLEEILLAFPTDLFAIPNQSSHISKAVKMCLFAFQNAKIHYGLNDIQSQWYSLKSKVLLGNLCLLFPNAEQELEEAKWWISQDSVESLCELEENLERLDDILLFALYSKDPAIRIMSLELTNAHANVLENTDQRLTKNQSELLERIAVQLYEGAIIQ